MENKEKKGEKEENFILDKKDKKILQILDFHGRCSYTQLAKKVGMSKQGVDYKVRLLQKRGVIQGFYPVINVPKLGYLYCRMLLTFQNVTLEKKEQILKKLKEHKKVFWLLEMHGPYDILIVMWAKTVSEYMAFADEIQNMFGAYIKKKKETIATDVIHLEHRYLLHKEETKEIHIRETKERITLDDLDREILQLLCLNGRVSLVEIATKCKKSAKVVAYRIKRMKQQKLIEAYRPILDHKKIGYTYYKLFIHMNGADSTDRKKVKVFIKQHSAVIYMVEGFGLPADLDIEIMVHSTKELLEFINTLRFSFPTIIGEYETALFVETKKVKYLPF